MSSEHAQPHPRADGPTAGRPVVLPERHPRAPAPGAPIPTHYPLCFGCGRGVPSGLRMRLRAEEGLHVSAEFEVTENHQGAPGLAHGGIVAAAFDEALGGLNWLLAVPAVTAQLDISFRKPIQIGQTLHFDCEITGVSGRKVYNRAVARCGSVDGPVAAEAKAIYVQVPLEHFAKHGRRDQVERFAAERGVRPGGTTAGGSSSPPSGAEASRG